MVKAGFVSVQGYILASCASFQVVRTTHVETVPPVFQSLEQILSASAHMGNLDLFVLMVRVDCILHFIYLFSLCFENQKEKYK